MNIEILKKAKKIFSIATKPTNQDFLKIAKITGAGMVAIGLVGLAIAFIFRYL